jgi:hypothetical protein
MKRRPWRGDDGRFVFQGLEAAKYTLLATARGYVRENYNQHSAFTTSVAAGNGLDSEHVIFRLHRQVIVTGRVTDEHGEAARHAQVMLFSTESTSGRHARFVQAQMQTDDLGEYRFAHLQPGKYYVAVTTRPWYAQTRLSYSPEQDGRSFRPMNRLAASDPSLDVVFPTTFYPGVTDEHAAGRGQVTGVAKVDGKPTAGVMVLLIPETGQDLQEDTRMDQSDSDGPFALGGILPGKYLLLAIEDGWDLEWTNRGISKPYLEKAQALQVSADDQKKTVVEVQHNM